MSPKFFTVLFAFLFSAVHATAGAWSMNSFDNDDALDWVENELKDDSLQAARSAIGFVLKHKGDLEAPQCSYAVAACEVLAAARGKPSRYLPADVAALAKTIPAKMAEGLSKDAIKALRKIAAKSELRDLMKESGGLEEWMKLMDDLRARLELPGDRESRAANSARWKTAGPSLAVSTYRSPMKVF